MGKFDEFEKNHERWKESIDHRISVIEEFIDELRIPHRSAVWVIRAIFVAFLGGLGTTFFIWIRERLH